MLVRFFLFQSFDALQLAPLDRGHVPQDCLFNPSPQFRRRYRVNLGTIAAILPDETGRSLV